MSEWREKGSRRDQENRREEKGGEKLFAALLFANKRSAETF